MISARTKAGINAPAIYCERY